MITNENESSYDEGATLEVLRTEPLVGVSESDKWARTGHVQLRHVWSNKQKAMNGIVVLRNGSCAGL